MSMQVPSPFAKEYATIRVTVTALELVLLRRAMSLPHRPLCELIDIFGEDQGVTWADAQALALPPLRALLAADAPPSGDG